MDYQISVTTNNYILKYKYILITPDAITIAGKPYCPKKHKTESKHIEYLFDLLHTSQVLNNEYPQTNYKVFGKRRRNYNL